MDSNTDLLSSNPRTPKIFDRFDDSSSSDDDFSPSPSSSAPTNPNCSSTSQNGVVKAAGKKLDYMIQFLDRKLSKASTNNNSTGSSSDEVLAEFVAAGGGTGMFRLPVRAAVRPDRPPSLEVRPHPLRETQVGCGLGVVLCTETQLRGGGESGVRCWEFEDVFSAAGEEEAGAVMVGDEMTAVFRSSAVTEEVTCMVGDEGGEVVWSGHKDGRIRCWKMKEKRRETGFRECLSWQAHRGPVLSMVMTSYGYCQWKAKGRSCKNHEI